MEPNAQFCSQNTHHVLLALRIQMKRHVPTSHHMIGPEIIIHNNRWRITSLHDYCLQETVATKLCNN